MRTTLRLNDALLTAAKKLAVETRRTLTQVVEDALRVALVQRGAAQRRRPIRLHTCGGKGLQAGVDLNNNAALGDLMDQHDGFARRKRPG